VALHVDESNPDGGVLEYGRKVRLRGGSVTAHRDASPGPTFC